MVSVCCLFRSELAAGSVAGATFPFAGLQMAAPDGACFLHLSVRYSVDLSVRFLFAPDGAVSSVLRSFLPSKNGAFDASLYSPLAASAETVASDKSEHCGSVALRSEGRRNLWRALFAPFMCCTNCG